MNDRLNDGEQGVFNFRLNNFNLICLLAAIQVVLWHGIEHLHVPVHHVILDFLNYLPGVPIFFVISGYLIAASLERTSSIWLYVQNRLLRIYPALWACFALSLAIVLFVFQAKFTLKQLLVWGCAQLSIGQFYNPEFLSEFGLGVLNGSLWTIPVELQFYMVLPFLYFFLKWMKWNKWSVIALMLALAAFNQIFVYQFKGEEFVVFKLLGVSVFPYLYMFLLGVLLQKHIWFVERFLHGKALLWLGVLTVWSVIAYFLGLPCQGNYLNPVSALLLGLLTISLAYSRVGTLKWLIGNYDISYGVYIYHMLIINLLLFYGGGQPWGNLTILVVGSVVIATLSWVFIEKPALSLKKIAFRGAK